MIFVPFDEKIRLYSLFIEKFITIRVGVDQARIFLHFLDY